ncbi:MAG: hypothetical protein VKL60_00390 [Sphaerospermopsis sp.]|nr:hypothetical protein [Sphaerospermopsis sp.]
MGKIEIVELVSKDYKRTILWEVTRTKFSKDVEKAFEYTATPLPRNKKIMLSLSGEIFIITYNKKKEITKKETVLEYNMNMLKNLFKKTISSSNSHATYHIDDKYGNIFYENVLMKMSVAPGKDVIDYSYDENYDHTTSTFFFNPSKFHKRFIKVFTNTIISNVVEEDNE